MNSEEKSSKYALCTIVGLLTLALGGLSAGAGDETRVPVTLFGQPCLLKGPLDEKTLKIVHSVSPEQIVPPFTSSRTSEQTRRAMDRLQNTAGLPSALDRYREQLGGELKAQLAFLDGLDAARKAGTGAPIVNATKPFLTSAKQKEFETLAGRLNGKTSAQQTAVIEQLFDLYTDAAVPEASAPAAGAETTPGSSPGSPSSPSSEEEFHRAIRRLGIQYACNFDVEDGPGAPENSGEDDGATAGAKKKPKVTPTSSKQPQQAR